jgi:hypothetical protein
VPVRSLVVGAAALSCGVRAIEQAKEDARNSFERLGVPVPTTFAVPFFAPTSRRSGSSKGAAGQESGRSHRATPDRTNLETVALLSEAAPLARAVAGMGGDQWEAFSSALWSAGTTCAHRETCGILPLPAQPLPVPDPAAHQACSQQGQAATASAAAAPVELTRPLLAGEDATVLHVGDHPLESKRTIPTALAAHPLWRAASPLFADEVRWKLGQRGMR